MTGSLGQVLLHRHGWSGGESLLFGGDRGLQGLLPQAHGESLLWRGNN